MIKFNKNRTVICFIICLVCMILTYFIGSVSFLNKWIMASWKNPYNIYYQFVNIGGLFLFYFLYLLKNNQKKINYLKCVLFSLFVSYIITFIFYVLSPIIEPDGYRSLQYFITKDPIGSFLIIGGYPVITCGWIYGVIMGMLLYCIIRFFNNKLGNQ